MNSQLQMDEQANIAEVSLWDQQFGEAVLDWRKKEDKLKSIEFDAKKAKEKVTAMMMETGLKQDKTLPMGSISLVKTTKANILVPEKEWKNILVQKGWDKKYSKVTLDMEAVKQASIEGGEISNYVEVESTYSPRFYPSKAYKEMNHES